MSMYRMQIECLSCSNHRGFVHHADRASIPVSQQVALGLPRGSVLSCGRCGSTSLARAWSQAMPYDTTGDCASRRRRRAAIAWHLRDMKPL